MGEQSISLIVDNECNELLGVKRNDFLTVYGQDFVMLMGL